MKKLIALLSGLTITASTASVAVACTNYDKKIDGNSVLIQFLQSMDGVVSIDASDVLWKLINESGPQNRESFLIQLLKLINVSILSNSSKNLSGETSMLNIDAKEINQGLGDAIINKWNSVSAAVDLQIQREKDGYQRSYGKKWQDKWKEMLIGKFTVYQESTDDMDLDFLEAKYKASILMTDATNSATKGIIDVLINTDSYGVTWISSASVVRKYNALKNAINNDVVFKQILDADQLALQQIQNASLEDANDWKTETEFDVTKAKEIINSTDVTKLVNEVPEDVNVWSVNGASSRAGMLSNSQLFFINKYYETKAPVALSEVVISFSDNQKFDDGITLDDFKGDGDVDLTQTKLLLPLLEDDSLWNTALVKNDVFTGVQSKATIKTYDSLLTLTNSEYSDTLKSVVYDYLLGAEDKGTAEATLESIVGLDRTQSNKIYANFGSNTNKLVYIDTDGIHIVRIEGYEYMGKTNNTRSSTIKELQQFNKFHSLKDQEKIDGIITNSGTPTYLSALNTGISDQYLQYLVNSSLLKGLNSSPIKYDIINEVKSWATISSSSTTETYWITAIFEYFQTISTAQTDTASFVSKFLVFGVSDPINTEANNIALSMQQWTVDKISAAQQNVQIASSVKFIESFKNAVKTIQSNTSSQYPKATLSGKNFVDSELAETIAKKWNSDVLSLPSSTTGSETENPDGTRALYVLNQLIEGVKQ